MPTLHEELWRYHDDQITAVAFRVSEALGRLVITVRDREPLSLTIPLSAASPTEEDDAQWFTTTMLYTEETR